jgi:hypothetical protein
MKSPLRWFLIGFSAALVVLLLAFIFMAYQMPGLLLNWTDIRYCA